MAHPLAPACLPAFTRGLQNLDRLLRTHATDHFRKLEALLASLPPRCLLFAGYCSRSLARAEAKREGGPQSLSRFFGGLGGDTGFGGGGGGSAAGGGGDDLALLDRFGRGPGCGQRKSTKGRLLAKMLPNHLELHPPNQEAHVCAYGCPRGLRLLSWPGQLGMGRVWMLPCTPFLPLSHPSAAPATGWPHVGQRAAADRRLPAALPAPAGQGLEEDGGG